MSTRFIDRDISWLSFNYRVLQEAKDSRVPLYERLRFLAIYSSNLDEFFRVRVASLRSLLSLKEKTQKKLDLRPGKLLRQIHEIVDRQQDEFGEIFRESIVRELHEHGIWIINELQLSAQQKLSAKLYFREHLLPILRSLVVEEDEPPFLQNRFIYLAARLLPKGDSDATEKPSPKHPDYRYAIVEIPSQRLPRFIELPQTENLREIIFLDDIIRLCLPDIFPGYDVISSYSIKLTRDAELYIEDEFSGNLLEKIKKGLRKRSTGVPSRFLYDLTMPRSFLAQLVGIFSLQNEDLIPGGHYHNFNDFFSFPTFGLTGLEYDTLPPLHHPELDASRSIFQAIAQRDYMLHFPYHSYDYVIRFLNEAAEDPDVLSIEITLYRAASGSAVVAALIDASRNGKTVTAFVEVKARFDEESNIQWAEDLENAGVKVLYSFPGLKVHSKLCLIKRRENGGIGSYAYLATGNFNEKTARVYSDHGLFTADERLTGEVAKVFTFLANGIPQNDYQHLLVAPSFMRNAFNELLDNEIQHARAGNQASVILKLNSLEDPEMIRKLYEAGSAGVKIQIIVRGICSLIPGVKGLSENISAISIVDRFLEHARVYIFHNGGDERYYVASADWMTRNLSRRVEVAFPVYDDRIKRELQRIIDLQLNDRVKARIINRSQSNKYRKSDLPDGVASQQAIYQMLRLEQMLTAESKMVAQTLTSDSPQPVEIAPE